MTLKTETIGDCTLICGDCIDIMPTLGRFDAIVTDPPYSSGGFTQAAKTKAKGQGLRGESLKTDGWFAGDAMTAAGAAFLLRELARHCFDTSTNEATLSVFTDWRVCALYSAAIESARWRYQNLIVWDKGGGGLGTGFRAQHELIMHFSKGAPPYYSKTSGNVISAPRVPPSQKTHGCEKPVALIGRLLQTVSKPGGHIVDPFMGSGTTGVACARLGRRFTGLELDSAYFEVACERIREAYRQPRLFDDAAPKPTQTRFDLDGVKPESGA